MAFVQSATPAGQTYHRRVALSIEKLAEGAPGDKEAVIQVLRLISQGFSIAHAARECGVPVATASRWWWRAIDRIRREDRDGPEAQRVKRTKGRGKSRPARSSL